MLSLIDQSSVMLCLLMCVIERDTSQIEVGYRRSLQL